MVAEEMAVGTTKGIEYTRGDDRLDNFKRLAEDLGTTPEKILWVYLKKHMDAILHYIMAGHVLSEPIEERIKDARVFLGLLRGLFEERKGKIQTEHSTL